MCLDSTSFVRGSRGAAAMFEMADSMTRQSSAEAPASVSDQGFGEQVNRTAAKWMRGCHGTSRAESFTPCQCKKS